MNPTHPHATPSSYPQAARGFALRLALAGLVAGFLAAHSAHGQAITVPNGSFESPTTTFVTTIMTDWTKTPQPGYFDPTTFGFSWDQTAGEFVNTMPGTSNYINNLGGTQAAYLLTFPEAGFFQDLSATYTVGQQYELALGAISETEAGDTLLAQLYYRDGSNNIIPIGTDTVLSAGEGDINDMQYSLLQVPKVNASDAWAGQTIGVEISVGQGAGSGDWDVDNVTVTPEPGTGGLLALGLGLLLHRRRRRARA